MNLRTVVTTISLALVLVLFAGQLRQLLDDPTVMPPDDYVEYWAAGRLNLDGYDPYSPELLLPLEREAGRDTDAAVMMWNPPWTLAFVMPFGAMPPRVGQLAWLLTGFVSVGVSAVLLWNVYDGRPDRLWLPLALAVTFVPTLIVLRAGQIGTLLLLGAALFLWCERRGLPTLAGAAAVLLAIKPHLVTLFWLAVAVEAVAQRRWRIVAGGVAGGLIASAIPLAFNPRVFDQYYAAFRDHPPAEHVSLTIGTLLRVAFGVEIFWLQFVPVVFGVAWYVWHRLRHRREAWAAAMPLLVLVSFVTASYGAWQFDLVLMLLPVIRRAAEVSHGKWWDARFAVGVYLLTNAAMLGVCAAGVYSYWFGWVAPAMLVLYVVTGRHPRPTPVTPA